MIELLAKLFVSAILTVVIELASVAYGAPMPWPLAALVAVVLVFIGVVILDFDGDHWHGI